MQVSVESTSTLGRKMTVQVPAEKIDGEVEKRLRSMTGKVRISGFRPGKVPFKVVKQRYGKSVRDEVIGDVLQSSFYEALGKEKLRPAGNPAIDSSNTDEGAALEFTASFDVYPEFQVADITKLEIKKPTADVTAADIDKMLETLRTQNKTWQPVERESSEGDQIVIDFEGRIDGEVFEGGKGENSEVELGQGRMIAGFEEALLGLKAGEEKTFTVTFPEDYHHQPMAGKQATFTVQVKSVSESVLPEVDAEFAMKLGVADGNIETLRQEVGESMQRELQQKIQAKVKEQAMDGLRELHELELPQALIKQEMDALREQMKSNLQQPTTTGLPDDLFKDEAERRVKLGLIIGEIIKQHDIKVDQAKVEEMLNSMAASYQDPQQVIDYYRNNPQAKSNLEGMVLEQQVVDWVMANGAVTEDKMSFDELVNPVKTES